jgi:hypothetical protein
VRKNQDLGCHQELFVLCFEEKQVGIVERSSRLCIGGGEPLDGVVGKWAALQ